jgi:hypothetical protein
MRGALCGGTKLDHESLAALMYELERRLHCQKKRTPHLPIAFAEPGNMRDATTPPDMVSSYDASCVFKPSILRSHG